MKTIDPCQWFTVADQPVAADRFVDLQPEESLSVCMAIIVSVIVMSVVFISYYDCVSLYVEMSGRGGSACAPRGNDTHTRENE